jgi:hypothetical protein
MIIKVEMLLDALEDEYTPQIIADFLNEIFKQNDHLAKIIICEVTHPENEVKH